jgi:outer membrane receptor protein involved in Fe transport
MESHQQDYLLKPDQRRIDSDNEVEGAVIFINGSARQGGGDRSRNSAGLELALPVTTKLDVTAALRTDKYDDESSAVGRRNSAMINFAYRPNDKFLLRGSAGESFRAPDMHYVYAGSSSYFDSVTDFRQCFEAGIGNPGSCGDYGSTIKGRFQGNTALDEESGENYSLGFVWDFAEGASFTLDAFHVKLEGAVENLDVQAIANREAFCVNGEDFASWFNDTNFSGVDCVETLAAVEREAADPDQLGGSELGDIDEITTYNRNQAFEEFVGVDTTLRYSFSTETRGDWRFVLYNSNILSRKFKGDEISDTIEILDAYLYEPRSQQTATTTWRYNDWSVSWYIDRMGHTEQFYGEKADPYITHNLSATYNYSADLAVRATISNVEDRMPEKDSRYGWPYFNQGYYSIFGRAVYLSASYKF